ncbi:hypothetical protein E4T47_07625 [Aureobasidium subglaciale]|nr:hypothetical protein E4T47_07625 [Aureobasidium subglaciale]
MAASLGVTDMDVDEISRMLELRHTLLPMFQVSVAFLILTWTAVSLRVYVRASILRSFHRDDWLILLTLCVFSACCACLIAIEDIERSSTASEALSNGFAAQFGLIDKIFGLIMGFMSLYIVTTVVLKLALAIFFLRIIPENFAWQRKTIYLATGIYTTYGLVFAFIVIFQCGNPANFFVQEARKACVSDDILQPLYPPIDEDIGGLSTRTRGKPVTYTPGTFVSRMSFEDKINPYGDLQLGCVTTIVGNSDGTELRTIDRKAKNALSSIQEKSMHSRAPSVMSEVSRVDSGVAKLERASSLRSLMRHERYQFPRPPSAMKKAYIQNGRVVMSRDIKIEQELYVSHSQPSSPV